MYEAAFGPRRSAFRASIAAACLLAIGLVPPARATDDIQIGSFLSRERPMYLELDRLVGGQPFHGKLRNVPEWAETSFLIWSTGVLPYDLTKLGIPGFLGPDLSIGGLIHMPNFSIDGVAAPALNGTTLYLQPIALDSRQGRLGSMIQVNQAISDPPGDPAVQFPLALVTQELTTRHHSGRPQTDAPVRVGVPLPQGEVFETSGVPDLTLRGPSARGQFSTLARWPDGSVKWALAEYFADLGADEWSRAYQVDKGSGNFGGGAIATAQGNRITLDTGVMQAVIDGDSPDLFESVVVNGISMLHRAAGNRMHLIDALDREWNFVPLGAELRRNGPVRAEAVVYGAFVSPDGEPNKVYVRLYVEATHGHADLRVQTCLRNSAIDFENNLLFRGFLWQGQLKATGPYDIRAPLPGFDGADGGVVGAKISNGTEASLYQAFVLHTDDRLTYDHNDSSYRPFLKKKSTDDFVRNGVRLRISGQDYTGTSGSNGFSDRFEYCDSLYVELNNETYGMGVMLSIPDARVTWPCQIYANGDGVIEAQLFPRKDFDDDYDYPLTWGTNETRTFVLHFETQPAEDPTALAATFDYPVVARGDLWVYNQSDVWPWHWVSRQDLEDFCHFNGLKVPSEPTIVPTRTIYRYANGTGSFNNDWIATRNFGLWLRNGDGGALLRSWWEAVYKADKMPWTYDDGLVKDAGDVQNEADATKHGKFFDGSKHTYLQALADIAFWRGESYLFDSHPHFVQTVLDPDITSAQPGGNFVMGTYGAVGAASVALLQMKYDAALDANVRKYMDQWAQIVYKQGNSFGVDTSTKGWQAPIGTPVGEGLDPDGYFITKASGKSNDWDDYGYTLQVWTDYRNASLAYDLVAHYLEETAPGDPLIDRLRARGADLAHWPRRAAPDDFCAGTGEYYLFDVFFGDPGNTDVDPLKFPGDLLNRPKASDYVLAGFLLPYLETTRSESALSYGVELCRSMSEPAWHKHSGDPRLNEFLYQWLRHHGRNQR